MVVAKLMGRLGNQMFQYATARSAAARVDTSVKLDTSWIDYYRGRSGPNWPYELDRFPLDVEVGHIRKYARLPAHRRLQRALQRILPRRRPLLRVIREDSSYAFVPEVLTAGNDVYLDGFWQCEDYFSDSEGLVRSEFAFQAPLSESGNELARQIEVGTSVSLHVRRGDYLRVRSLHALDREYYVRALQLLADELGDYQVVVFSDDLEWCKAHLKLERPTVFVEREHVTGSALEDMHLMSLCDHHVIANSSFSWWGAWLDPRPDKIVVAPKCWFRDPDLEAGDQRVPPSWIRI
jgi:Glycosyl transferase family 11